MRPLFAGLTPALLIAIFIIIAGQLVLSRSVFGRYMTAVGTNEEAVRLSGISPSPIKVAVFTLSGLLAALGGIIESSRQGFPSPIAGKDVELEVIAAVVVGGTSLMGGRGSVAGTIFGTAVIVVLGAGLAAKGIQDDVKKLVTGSVIIGASILDYYRRRLAR